MSAEQHVPIPEASENAPEHYWHVPRLIVCWILTAVAATVACFLTQESADQIAWLTVVLAAGTLVTFALQLGTAQRQGFIARTALSVGGVVIIVALVAAVAFLTNLSIGLN